MTKIPEADTYIVAGENQIECKRCGARHPFTLPQMIDDWVAMVAEFNKQHANCPEPASAKPRIPLTELREALVKLEEAQAALRNLYVSMPDNTNFMTDRLLVDGYYNHISDGVVSVRNMLASAEQETLDRMKKENAPK
jgi:hypothetical protein